jgi:phosphomannomutase
MLENKWKRLQNGSDIRGVAISGVKGESVNLTDDVVNTIACAFALWLSKKKQKPTSNLTISVGHDSRLSAPQLKNAVIKGLTDVGANVFDCGMASTPAMFMTTVTPGYNYDGAIMITASHLPYNRNGLKFFTNEGGLEKQDITDILSLAQAADFPVSESQGNITSVDFISVYADMLVKKIREAVDHPQNKQKPLKDFKIIVDAGNGAGGFFVDKVLVPLGADVTGSQFLEPDGNFPNHIPNPEDKEAMDCIKDAVLKNHADLGIIFDADVDRAGAVDKNGREINKNRLIALMSAIVLEEAPGSIIVTDSITSSGLKLFIEDKLGGYHHRFKRGYKNVINEAIKLNNEGKVCNLAIETSGHGALKENYFLDDGAYLISKILIKMARLKLQNNKTIDSLLVGLAEPMESKEFRLNILTDNFKEYGSKVISDLTDYAQDNPDWQIAPDNYEGIRVSFDKNNGDGWFLLRMSLHDPLLPLNIESDSKGGVRLIANKLIPFLSKYDKLDTTPLKEFLK